MVLRKHSALNQRMLHRSRLHSLINDGLQHPLLVMLAGPGYGKTRAMAAYLSESDENAFWLRLTRLDNLATHFWNHVIQTFKPEYPDMAQRLSLLGFPDTLSSFDAFMQLLVEEYAEQKRLIWIFDDFGVINNEQIKIFVRMLVEAELEQFPVVLISNELASTDSIAFLSSRRFLVLAKDLRFTRAEIDQLYQMYNLSLKPEALFDIERHTEGWALALHLLVQQQNGAPAKASHWPPSSGTHNNLLWCSWAKRMPSPFSFCRMYSMTSSKVISGLMGCGAGCDAACS